MAVSDDFDELEKITDSLTTSTKGARSFSSYKGLRKMIDEAHKSNRRAVYYHSGPNKPSLPKLKFMEGKDD